ncbi:MAG: ECF transporter S component [Deltaproteobacteria bacterium]|jgi:energy-coupling factor transport system substrate-specific component|nr:ECF transporter S component [Deltaproteobacteria bacterium]
MSETSSWKLKDTILIGMVDIAFAVVYLGAVYLGIFLSALLTPLGLAPLANEPICGIWFMAATFIAFILRKPGVALVTEMLAALVEVLLGSFYGPLVFVDGFIQGLGAEAVFAAKRYKNYSLRVMCLAGLASAILSFIWELYRSGILKLDLKFILVMFPIRAISGVFFAGFICYKLALMLKNAGVFKAFEGNSGNSGLIKQ